MTATVIGAICYGQWQNFGNPFVGTQYLGINGAGGIPLRLTTVPNFPIELRTFNVQRARLNGNLTGPIGPNPLVEFLNINRDGFFLLSGTADAFTNAASRAPFTRLHLADNAVSGTDPVVYAQQHGFRPWQRNGITFTGNSDQSYIGHRYAGNDNTDFVVQWSDNPNSSPWGTDRIDRVANF